MRGRLHPRARSIQWRALVVLSVSLQTPVVTRVADDLTAAPVIENIRVAGVPTTVAVPPGGGRHPAIIFSNGAIAAGRFEPHVVRLAEALGRAGFLTSYRTCRDCGWPL